MIKLNLQQFGAPGLTTALRAETFDNLQLNAGVFLKDFAVTGSGAPTDVTTLKAAIAAAIQANKTLGATRGGGNFNVTRETRRPDIDGIRYPWKGGTFVDSADAYLATTLVESSPDNFKVALGSGVSTTSGKVTTIKMNTMIADTDYLTNLCWVGDLADGRLVVIVLYNALNTADLQFTFTDKNEGTIGVEFHAHQADFDEYDQAPFEVIFFEE